MKMPHNNYKEVIYVPVLKVMAMMVLTYSIWTKASDNVREERAYT
jgi:hypothetical protein